MDSTIRRILGEQEGEPEIPEKARTPQSPEGISDKVIGPEDTEVEELASMWTAGNKGEVIRRFMDMDNETSVKLVFAIGREAALELAQMVDQKVEQQGQSEESASSEPERIEPPADSYPVDEIIGRTAETVA